MIVSTLASGTLACNFVAFSALECFDFRLAAAERSWQGASCAVPVNFGGPGQCRRAERRQEVKD